jgi:hypothetical protein
MQLCAEVRPFTAVIRVENEIVDSCPDEVRGCIGAIPCGPSIRKNWALTSSCLVYYWHPLLAFFSQFVFTSRIAASLSMSYRPDPATSPGRSYLEIFSLFAPYNSIKDFDDVVCTAEEVDCRSQKMNLGLRQY